VPMPFLTHMTVRQQLTEQTAQMLAAVRLDRLHRLDVRMDLYHARILQGCTHLRTLTVLSSNIKGASAIAQLTGLTQLELHSADPGQQLFSPAEQSELGSALSALSNLQNLLLDHAPPGPVTQALSQLTGLTQLVLAQQDLVPNPGPLILPSCVMLIFWFDFAIQHLLSIDAPQLQHLNVRLALQPSDLDALKRLCRGVLRACSSLSLVLRAWSKEDTVALMAVLNKDWQPTAEALQPLRYSSIGLERSRTLPLLRQWSLELDYTHCSRRCLELIPKGLGSLRLTWVLWPQAHPFVWPSCTGVRPLPLPAVAHHSYVPILLISPPSCPVSPQALHR
jgi:hypothetical protein